MVTLANVVVSDPPRYNMHVTLLHVRHGAIGAALLIAASLVAVEGEHSIGSAAAEYQALTASEPIKTLRYVMSRNVRTGQIGQSGLAAQ